MEPIKIVQNYGAFFDKARAGVTGPVQLKGGNNGSTVDLSSQQWTYQVSSPRSSNDPWHPALFYCYNDSSYTKISIVNEAAS